MSDYIATHQPCPSCGSSDAFSIWSDGHGHCFSCKFHQPADAFEQPQQQQRKVSRVAEFVIGSFQDLVDRGIYEKTCKAFDYRVKDGVHIENYYDRYNNLVAQKHRYPNKDFRVVGDINKATLFAQQKWAPGNRLVITEGVLDALSYAQVTNCTWQVCSVPNGASSAKKYIKNELEFVESFEEVVFMFDMDEPGQNAALECAALLTPGKAKLAKLPLKDANDMLCANRGAEIKAAVYAATPYRPDGIIRGIDLTYDQVIASTPRGFSIPYPEINEALRGLRKRELILLCAGSGIGKSTLARELGYHLIKQHKQRIGWVMLEESVQKTVQGLVAIDNGVPLGDLIENPKLIEQPDWQRSMAELVTMSEFYDSWGSSEIDNLMSKLRYLAVGCGCDFIILDHVTMVVSGLDVEERKTLDVLMTKLRQVAEQTGVGIIGVAHLRRNSNKASFNEGGTVSITDLRGSAGLEQISDVVLACERNQQAEDLDDQVITQFRLLKNRPFGVVGLAGKAYYDRGSGRLMPLDEAFKDNIEVPF